MFISRCLWPRPVELNEEVIDTTAILYILQAGGQGQLHTDGVLHVLIQGFVLN